LPGMSGAALLAEVCMRAPDTVRVMLTGRSDGKAAAEAVNSGQVFRFLTKPFEPQTLLSAVRAAAARHHAQATERDLLENTFRGSIRMLAEVLSILRPAAFSRSLRVAQLVLHMAERLRLRESWRYETAALLSQIGSVALPWETLTKFEAGEELSEE